MLADILHKFADQFSDDEHEYYPRPSMSGPNRCIRQMVYHGLGFPRKPFPGRTLFVFDDGRWHEELTLDWIRKSAFIVHSEQMVVDCSPPMTTGSIDGIMTDLLGRDYLLELKSVNHFTFQRWANGENPEDYFAQTCIYYDALRKIASNISGALLLLKNKNTSAYLEYLIQYDGLNYIVIQKADSLGEIKQMNLVLEDIVGKACEKFLSVADYVKRKTLPKRQYDVDTWNCGYCAYGEICWEGYQHEFFELKTDVMLPNEVADMIRYYRQLNAQQKDMASEYEELRSQIMKIMKGEGVREGYAGEFLCKLKLQKNNVERLYISTLKEKRHGNGI